MLNVFQLFGADWHSSCLVNLPILFVLMLPMNTVFCFAGDSLHSSSFKASSDSPLKKGKRKIECGNSFLRNANACIVSHRL